eukprot:gnl/Chilomastix_cuspidata/9905.p2 GENE.gnl/Chilomastix_cuspidata/9905~~gnl/Chilomastix_cuspidata/9905.p2  ORF type:complete len:121 (-),score=1.41 gnl/Chilomastix_cuspidata/9905:619-981(-)
MPYLYIFFTIVLTCYGQVILKWRIPLHGDVPEEFFDKVCHILSLFLDFFILSSFAAAFIASLCYIYALSKLPLSHAYPFMGASFAIVLLCSAFFFKEPLNLMKISGVFFIMFGIAIGSQG